jgi:hypothetical protein
MSGEISPRMCWFVHGKASRGKCLWDKEVCDGKLNLRYPADSVIWFSNQERKLLMCCALPCVAICLTVDCSTCLYLRPTEVYLYLVVVVSFCWFLWSVQIIHVWMYIKVYKGVCWLIHPCLGLYHIFLFYLYLLTKCLSLEECHDHPCPFLVVFRDFSYFWS